MTSTAVILNILLSAAFDSSLVLSVNKKIFTMTSLSFSSNALSNCLFVVLVLSVIVAVLVVRMGSRKSNLTGAKSKERRMI